MWFIQIKNSSWEDYRYNLKADHWTMKCVSIYAVVFPSQAIVHHSFANEYLASILALVPTLYLVRAIDAFFSHRSWT